MNRSQVKQGKQSKKMNGQRGETNIPAHKLLYDRASQMQKDRLELEQKGKEDKEREDAA